MARKSIAANLNKMLKVQEGVGEGLSLSKACKAAGTSSGTYKRWLERHADLLMPCAVVPFSRQDAFALSDDGRYLVVLRDDEAGITLLRIDTSTGEEIILTLDRPRGQYDYRTIVTAETIDGQRVVFVLSDGAVMSWVPETGALETCPLSLADSGCALDSKTYSGVRQWAPVAITPDLSHVAYWQPGRDEEEFVLRVVGIADGVERMHYTVSDRSSTSAIVLHPRRPLVSILGPNKLIILLNHETGEELIASGPQVHSASFGPGDALLFDDWYGKTRVLNCQDGTTEYLSQGWGSHASQSSRFLTASSQELHLRDIADSSRDRTLSFDEITACALSVDGSALVVCTDHVCLWRIETLLGEPQA